MTKKQFVEALMSECDDVMDEIVYEKSNGNMVVDLTVVGELAYDLMLDLVKAGKGNGHKSKPRKGTRS